MPSDDPFDDIFDAIGDFVDDLFGGTGVPGRPVVDARGVRVDIHERDRTVEVVADLPGADAGTVEMECDGEVLRILADGVDSHVELPAPVDERSADAAFNNGVLSVTFEREGATQEPS